MTTQNDHRRDSLRVHRVRAGLTQVELAARLGVRGATISNYETGDSFPSGPMLQDIARILGCSADDIDLSKAVA